MLVLDEAWTGLDVEAKAALDDAVAERLADGGSVVFVDHEPGRLAHLEADRWRLEDGQAARVATSGAGQDRATGRPWADAAGTALPSGRWPRAQGSWS